MEKAYDHVNWYFLLYLLGRCGFWVRWYIATTKFSILVNGNPVGFLNSSRDLRQGDSLFPLLFVIVMEALSRMLTTLVNNRFVDGFSVGDPNMGNLNTSHLQFADDRLIFCEVDKNHIQALRALLLCFEAASVLKVDFDKSELVPAGNIRNIRKLANTLRCKVSALPMNYLGLPLGAALRAKSIWDTVIKKIERRLAGFRVSCEKDASVVDLMEISRDQV
ncbi:hypothetical protein F2P56_007450 [Juglans regia]|uniref:Uncharacterized protein LOC108999323 n=2 Tax=Juglans regia TaxID=51240 RepID=A0A2I4FJD3_JUGRE|nr:uncharacterized protein LOC108999323 [Juglans regia]KAF5475670.1 hypothetical protein F2P56_007450 [Juglans regia]